MHALFRLLYLNRISNALLFLVTISLICLSLVSRAQEACLLEPVSLEQRAQQASLIVEASVISQQSYWDAAHQNIYTRHTLQLFKILKGSAAENLTVITEGGQVGDTYHAFTGTLQLASGQQGIFFLVPAASKMLPPGQSQPAYMVYSSSQGFIQYDSKTQQATEPFKTYPTILSDLYPALQKVTRPTFKTIRPNPAVKAPAPTGRSVPANNQRLKATPAISGFSPDTITAGTGSILTISGSNFGSSRGNGSVQFRNADNGGANFIQIPDADYVSWSDSEIQVRVAGKNSTNNTPGSGDIRVTNNSDIAVTSAGNLVIKFAVSQVINQDVLFRPRLVNTNGLGGYTFQFTAAFNQNTAAKDAFTRALNTWSCHTGINWNTTGQPTPLDVTADDNVNLVRFDTGDELPNGVLARCISRYNGCGNGTADQWRVNEMDVVFDQQARWNYGPGSPQVFQVDFETVTLHEMGHGHQLNHVIKPGTVMHYAITRGQETRQLDARTDIGGGQFTMSQNIISNQCGPGRMIPQPSTACSPSSDFITFTAEVVPPNEVRAAWTVNTTSQPAYFTLERSKDAAHWQPIGTIPPTAGPSYTFSDSNPLPGVSYYRLNSVSPDQPFSYSTITRINRDVPAGLAIAPNPVMGTTLWLQYVSPESGQLTIYFFDAAGRLQKKLRRSYLPNSDVIDLDISGLSPGLYVLVYDDGRQTRREKFIKL